jgi:hypothetical protein
MKRRTQGTTAITPEAAAAFRNMVERMEAVRVAEDGLREAKDHLRALLGYRRKPWLQSDAWRDGPPPAIGSTGWGAEEHAEGMAAYERFEALLDASDMTREEYFAAARGTS